MRDLTLTLRPRFVSAEADKAIKTQQKLLKDTQSLHEKINKESKKGLADQEKLWTRLGSAVTRFGSTAASALNTTLTHVNNFQRGLEGAAKKVVNFRNVIMGSAVGYGAVALGRRVLHAGAGDVRNARMLTREFGPGLLKDLALKGSKDISAAAGIEDDDALVGLLPIMRAIRETRIGDKFGGKTIKNKSQLEEVQRKQFATASNRFKQLAVLNPGMSPEQIGFLLAEAGTGEEGMRGLGRALNLGRASMADIMRDAKKKKMGTADIVGAMFERAGYTDKAMSAEQQSFEFQIKQLGTAVETAMGDVGSKAIEKLNERLGGGASLAEKFNAILEKNKDTIDKLANGFATMVEKLIDLAEKLPSALSWLDEHKGTLLAIGGIYGGLRVAGGVRDLLGKSGVTSAVGGLVDKVAGGGGTPVFVTNWPGSGVPGAPGVPGATGGGGKLGVLAKVGAVAAAASAGYAVGTAADEATGGRLSGGLSRALDGGANAMNENIGVEAGRAKLASANSDRLARIAMLESKGIDHGSAVFAADNPLSQAGMATMKRAGISFGGLTVNVGAMVGQNAPSIVKALMPDLQEQLTRAIRAAVPAQ